MKRNVLMFMRRNGMTVLLIVVLAASVSAAGASPERNDTSNWYQRWPGLPVQTEA